MKLSTTKSIIIGVLGVFVIVAVLSFSEWSPVANSTKIANQELMENQDTSNKELSEVDGVDKAETLDVAQKNNYVDKEDVSTKKEEEKDDVKEYWDSIKIADEWEPPEHIYPYCTESDGGPKYETQGTLTRCVEEGNCLTEIDTCLSDTTLLEYYCKEGGSMSTLEQNCEAGCNSGACLPVEEEEEKVEYSNEVVQESKENIMTYGFSNDYFDDHFTYVSASIAITSGAHVTWLFEVGEYETEVRDGIGCNNCNRSNMNYVHRISPAPTIDPPLIGEIESVISKSKADELMASCVGDDFIEEKVQLNLVGPTRGLLFIASPKEGAYQCPGDDSMAPCINKIGVIDLVTGSVLECNS